MSLAGKMEMDFVDNTGTTVTCLVSDPEVCIALVNPSLGERAPAPDFQLVGPRGMRDYVDLFPSKPKAKISQAGLDWDEIILNWDDIPNTWEQLT